MPDGTSRFSSAARRCITTWAATFATSPCCPRSRSRIARTRRSTRSATSAAASRPASARWSTRPRSRPAPTGIVFGLGGIGLNVIQGLRLVGADRIIGVDLNPAKKAWGERFGMTHFVNPSELGGDLVPYLVNLIKRSADRWRRGLHLRLHRQRPGDARGVEACHRGWGQVDRHRRRRGRERSPPALPAVTGRAWMGTAFGGARAAPTCRRSSTGTWPARSRSTR